MCEERITHPYDNANQYLAPPLATTAPSYWFTDTIKAFGFLPRTWRAEPKYTSVSLGLFTDYVIQDGDMSVDRLRCCTAVRGRIADHFLMGGLISDTVVSFIYSQMHIFAAQSLLVCNFNHTMSLALQTNAIYTSLHEVP